MQGFANGSPQASEDTRCPDHPNGLDHTRSLVTGRIIHRRRVSRMNLLDENLLDTGPKRFGIREAA